MQRPRSRRLRPLIAAFVLLASAPSASANNYGESVAWQFMTPAERAARLTQLDLIQKQRASYYAAPVYNTRIDRQINCSINASATGNSGGQTAYANSPTVAGASADAAGNSNGTDVAGGTSGTSLSNGQSNSGTIHAGVIGSTDTQIQGVAWQALNSTQTNSGNQSATITQSQACSFGALNG